MRRYIMPLAALVALAVFAFLGLGHTSRADARTIRHPDKPGAVVEYFVEKPAVPGPWPMLVFLHGHQSLLSRPGGAAFADWGVLRNYAQRGYLA